jgi:hypothetical protein
VQEAQASTDQSDQLQEQLDRVMAEKTKLEKQLAATQNDVIEARQLARASAAKGAMPAKDDNSDVAALLAENKRLQAELAQSMNKDSDTQALETEITALRAQNKTLNEEINKRLAAAPDRATIDNAQAKAAYTEQEAKSEAKAQVAHDLARAQTRANEADAENVRLARELAQARQALQQKPAVQTAMVTPQPGPARMQPIVQPMQSMQTAPQQTPSAMYTQASLEPAPSMPVQGPDGRDIAGYLQRAGIPMVSGFEKINKVSTASFAAFRWDTGVVFGTAEQERVNNAQAFKAAIAAYMDKTRNRCSGTFDQSMADGNAGANFATADVACIMPDGTGAGAAVVFYYKDGLFNAVAHEGNLDTFDQAMATRDKLAGIIKGQL